MKAVVFHDIGNITVDDVPEPTLQDPNDAIIAITASAICGTDLHMIRGTMSGMVPGTILGHEAVGVVESVGDNVRRLNPGDRVVVPSTIGCGYCRNCNKGYFSKCNVANPNGKNAGPAFYGGPKETGPFNGLQAEKARIPFASVGLVKLPDDITDEQAIFLSDILPTGYFGAELADIQPGQTVAVFGCGPVGLLAIASALHMQAGRVFAIDNVFSRLEMARGLGAEIINFDAEDPVEVIKDLTGGFGVNSVIDAVGVDSQRPQKGPAAKKLNGKGKMFDTEQKSVAPKTHPHGKNWHPGDGPSQALEWGVDSLMKVGTLSIIGEYPPSMEYFPIGKAMQKGISLRMGACHHRKYIPPLLDLIVSGQLDPSAILTHRTPFTDVIKAYKAFDARQPDWVKVELVPGL